MHLVLQRLGVAPQRADTFLQFVGARLGSKQRIVRAAAVFFEGLLFRGQRIDLALTLHHPVGAVVRRVVREAVAGQQLPAA